MERRVASSVFHCVALIGLSILIAGPAFADTDASVHGKYRGQCRRLSKQIDHYEYTILPLALERGNRAWEQATMDQVERLWHRRADLCPEYGAERTMMARAAEQARRFNQLLKQAGRAAATFFSGGIVP